MAVALVFAHHSSQAQLPGGFIGVDLFFVVSGFLISGLLMEEYARTNRIDLKAFYARRVLRLYPALIVMVLIATVTEALVNIGKPMLDAAASIFYVWDFYTPLTQHLSLLAHTWSLGVEEQFYIFWPALLIFVRHKRLSLIASTWFVIAAGIVTSLPLFAHDAATGGSWPFTHFAELGGGILIAIAARDPPPWLVRASGTPTALIALVGIGMFSFIVPSDKFWAFPLAGLLGCALVSHLVLHQESRISQAFVLRWLVWFGERSYGFYLWHYPILLYLQLKIGDDPAVPIGLVASLIAMELSWLYVERPFLLLKPRFERVQELPIHCHAVRVTEGVNFELPENL